MKWLIWIKPFHQLENLSAAKEMKSYSWCDIYIFEYLHVYFLNYCSEPYETFIGHAKNSSQLLYLSHSPVHGVSNATTRISTVKEAGPHYFFLRSFIQSYTHAFICSSYQQILKRLLHAVLSQKSLQCLCGIRLKFTSLLLKAFPGMVSFKS